MWHERRVLWIQMVAINFLLWEGVSYSNEIKGNQEQYITDPGVSNSNEFNDNQHQDYSKDNTLCSTPQSTQTGGGTNGDKTSDPTPAPSTKIVVSYWIIGIACGIVLLLIIIAVILPYKLYKREQPDPECSQQIPSPRDDPPDDMSHSYAKVQKEKSKENCPSAVDDINYSTVKFSKEVPTNKVEQSNTDYSEIKCP